MAGELTKPDALVVESYAGELLADAMAGLSPNTKRAYEGDWRRFGKWWDGRTAEQAVRDLMALDSGPARMQVLRYKEHLLELGRATATVARAMRSMNAISKRLHYAGVVRWELGAPSPRVERYRDTRGPALTQWAELLQALRTARDEPQDPRAVRDLAIILLLRDSALRRAEVCSLDYPAHVDLEERQIQLLGKGRRERERHPITTRCAKAIDAWLELRSRRKGPLFYRMTRSGEVEGLRIDGNSVQYLVAKWGRRAGIDGLSPHQLRHAGITAAAQRWEGPMVGLSRFARHKNPATTLIYVDNIAEQPRKIADLLEDEDAQE